MYSEISPAGKINGKDVINVVIQECFMNLFKQFFNKKNFFALLGHKT